MVTINVPESFFSLTLSQIKTSKELVDYFVSMNDRNFYTPVFRGDNYGISVSFTGSAPPTQPPFYRQRINGVTLHFFESADSGRPVKTEHLWRKDIAEAILKEKTIAVLFKEWERNKSENDKGEVVDNPDNDKFFQRWGRKRYRLEPEEGFLVQVFKPTPEDDGKVAINGYVFDPVRHPNLKHFVYVGDGSYPGLVENRLAARNIFSDDRIDRILTKTREEAAALIRLPENGIDKVFAVERFFGKDLQRELWDPLAAKLQKYYVEISSHPTKGTPCIMALPLKRYRDTLSAKENRVHILADTTGPEAFQRFVGEIVLNPSPGRPVHNNKELSRD